MEAPTAIRAEGCESQEKKDCLDSEQAIGIYLASSPCGAGPLIRSYINGRAITAKRISELAVEVLRDAGVKQRARDGVSGHAYRHSAAGDMLDKGADLRDVMEFLGHTNLATTSIYLKRRGATGRLREVMDQRGYLP